MYVELWNTGNFDLLKSLLPTPAYMHSHGHQVVMDQAMLKRVVTAWRRSMPDLTLNVEDTIIQGDKVAMRLTLKGSYREVLFPNTTQPGANFPNSGIHATEMLMFQLKDGKIHDVWEEYDELAMRIQMGAEWKLPPQATAPASRR